MPPRILYEQSTQHYKIIIEQVGHELQMGYAPRNSNESRLSVTGFMARMDLSDPFKLVQRSSVALMASVAFRPDPIRAYIIGFGAGRIPSVLHHHYPTLLIDCTDVDSELFKLATQFFGVPFDDRLRLHIVDGLQFLGTLSGHVRYDVIIVDAFREYGRQPPHLQTSEFYACCREHLAPGGVVAVNILPSETSLDACLHMVRKSFDNCYVFSEKGVLVIFAHDGPRVPLNTLRARAQAESSSRGFCFPFSDAVAHIGYAPEEATDAVLLQACSKAEATGYADREF